MILTFNVSNDLFFKTFLTFRRWKAAEFHAKLPKC